LTSADHNDVPLVAIQEENTPFNTSYYEQTFTMAPKPLNILKNGLDKFSKKIKT